MGDLPGDAAPGVPADGAFADGKRFRYSVQSRVAQPTTFWVSVRKPRLAKAAEPPSDKQIARKQQDDALNRAIDVGEDIGIVRRDWAYDMDWGTAWGTDWIGTKQDLLAAKLCDEQHFPVPPKRVSGGNADGRPMSRGGIPKPYGAAISSIAFGGIRITATQLVTATLNEPNRERMTRRH